MIEYHYIIFIIILFFLTFTRFNEEKRFKWVCILTFFFIGFRACVVGADTYNYTLGYMGYDYYKEQDVEPLYRNAYVPFLSNIVKYEPFFVFINTVFSLSPLYFMIKKYSNNKTMSILTFFLFDLYLMYFVALRQILSLGIWMCGLMYFYEKKSRRWLVYLLFTIIAYGFHTSSLIPSLLGIITYCINLKSRKLVLITIALTGVLGVLLNVFHITDIFNLFLNANTGLTTERLNEYMIDESYRRVDVASTSGYIYQFRFTWLGLWVFYAMDHEKINHWFSKLFFISICLYNIFYEITMISRMILGFQIFSIIVFTWSLGNRYKSLLKRNKSIVIFPILIFAWYTQAYVRSHIDYDLYNVDRMHPYYFFWEDYSSHPSIKRF